MPVAELTAVERGVLFALMASGRPLRESADLKVNYNLVLKPNHRAKLKRLELVETTEKPFTHSLSPKGWQWLEEQLSVEAPPKGLMGMGPLYALLHGLRRYIERNRCNLKEMFSEGGKSKGDVVARESMENAAWAEADEALAKALQDMSVFTRSISKLQDAAQGNISELTKRTASASNLVLQSVRQAARKRELSFATEEGGEAAFDPAMHRSDETLNVGAAVRIRKAPVIRGPAKLGVVVLRGEVEQI
jgi:hypothetical protein